MALEPVADSTAPEPPAPRRDEVELYVRTYSTILRSSGESPLRAFATAHCNVGSSLHAGASSPDPDTGALIYAVNRLPACLARVRRVILGQLPEHFTQALGQSVDSWQRVEAPARRRQWRYDGDDTLAGSVVSASDVDDVIPTLVAYQIEWNKLHDRLNVDHQVRTLLEAALPDDPAAERIRAHPGIAADDWQQLARAWGADFWPTLRAIAAAEKDFVVRLLGGTHVGYAKLIRRWWQPIEALLAERGLAGRPVYFVSSNLHSLVNLVSGYATRRAELLWEFLDRAGEADPRCEAGELADLRGQANTENVLYYAARLWHQSNRGSSAKQGRSAEELERGISTLATAEGANVGAQVIELACLRPSDLDPRLADLAAVAPGSDAVVVNIDYPLGMAAYHILRQVAEAVDSLLGVYVLGKAATLNGDIGDVLISDFVYDEHTRNTYSFDNAFSYGDVAPYLERGSVLDNQRTVTVKGTFLQNRDYLDFFYRESYTVVEMESGPYLSAVYEATNISRYPLAGSVHFRRLPLDFGLIHYASDTPYTRARTLGGRSLSFEGVDSTYAAAVAILRRILSQERARAGADA